MPAIRIQQQAHQVFEVTMRTQQARMLLRPDKDVNAIVLREMALAQRRYPVRIYAFAFMSNHYHILVAPEDANQLAGFMRMFNAGVSRDVGALRGWDGGIWHGRYRPIPVDDDERVLQQRLRYILEHGVKEGAVDSCGQWPGVTSTPWLLHGRPITGNVVDRVAKYNAERREDHEPVPGEFENAQPIELSPLPCWADVPEDTWRGYISDMVADIDKEAGGAGPAEGVESVLVVLVQHQAGGGVQRDGHRPHQRLPLVGDQHRRLGQDVLRGDPQLDALDRLVALVDEGHVEQPEGVAVLLAGAGDADLVAIERERVERRLATDEAVDHEVGQEHLSDPAPGQDHPARLHGPKPPFGSSRDRRCPGAPREAPPRSSLALLLARRLRVGEAIDGRWG